MKDHSAQDVPVRIGDLHVIEAGCPGSLVAVGLGSCVGVAVIDERSGASALAHVFLPERPDGGGRDGAGEGTYADTAIPALVRRVTDAAGQRADARLIAVVAGGAQMFGARPGNDVGERNVQAVRAALDAAGVPIATEDFGGNKGRTMRIDAGEEVSVSVRIVGTEPQELWCARPTQAAALGRLAA